MGAAVAVPAAIGAAQLVSGLIQGRENAAATEEAAKRQAASQMATTALGAYAGGPWSATIPYMQENLSNLVSQYNDPNRQYINQNAGTNEGLNQAIQMGLSSTPYDTARTLTNQGISLTQSASGGLGNYLTQGQQNIGAGDITSYTNLLLDPSLINSQVDAYSRDIARNLGENVITGIRSADVATGNLGSSRGGIQEAIARRGAEDRIADFRGGLVSNAMNQAQNQLQSNVGNTMSGYRDLSNFGNATQQGAQNLLNLSQDQLIQLYNVGKAQQGIEQSNLNNQIGARDFGLTNQQNLANALQNYQGVGNLINYSALNPTLASPFGSTNKPVATSPYPGTVINIPKF